MPINDFQIKLATAYPELHEIESGRGKIFLGDIETDGGRKRAYIKLLNTENMAREALCNVLARKLYLPIQPAYYVNMNNTDYSGGKSGNIDGMAFGMLNDKTPSFSIRTIPEEDLRAWSDILPCAVFDEWIANNDRVPNNLVFDKNNVFWLFDHDDALKGHVRPETPVGPQLLAMYARGKSELELHRIRNNAMKFVIGYEEIDWNEIRTSLVVEQLTSSKSHFERYIKFLKDRIPYMQDILSHDLAIKQQDLNLPLSKDTKSQKDSN